MGILKTLERESRNFLRNPDRWVLGAFGGVETGSGVAVDEESALSWTALSAAVRIIAEGIATLPLNVYEKSDGGQKRHVSSHPNQRLFDGEPNPEQTRVEWFESYMANCVVWGDGFSELVMRDGHVREIWPIHPDRVLLERRQGRLVYVVTLPRLSPTEVQLPQQSVLFPEEVLHTRGFATHGLVGLNLSEKYREAIGLGIATERYAAHFFGNDASPGGVLQTPASLSDRAYARLKKSWEDLHRGISGSHRVAILEEDTKWQQVTVDPEKAEFLGLRQFQIAEVSRITRVPPHMLAELARATFSNIEEQDREFVRDVVRPWAVRIKQRFTKALFTEAERRRGLFCEFNLEGLLQGDTKTRGEFYKVGVGAPWMELNEARAKENLPPVDGGDTVFVPLNMVPLEQARNMDLGMRARLLGGGREERYLPAGSEDRASGAPAERRMVTVRRRLLAHFSPLVLGAMERMVRGEVRNLRSASDRLLTGDDPGAFLSWLGDYYFQSHPGFARGLVRPVFDALSGQVTSHLTEQMQVDLAEGERDKFVADYTDAFTNRYSASSRKQLEQVVREATAQPDGDPAAALEQRTSEWMDGTPDGGRPRAQRWSDRESHRLENAAAKVVFLAAGVSILRWRSFGESCPYCRHLDGVTVSIHSAFIGAGEHFQPEGADHPLVTDVDVGHPPAHSGCDCMIVPG